MEFIDLTLKVTPAMVADVQGDQGKPIVGHLGTHFDVMDKEFPLEFLERQGIVFDVSGCLDRDILLADIDQSLVVGGMFVAFYTGFIEKETYGSQRYRLEHPQLANDLITWLVDRHVSIIGIDFAGVRRGTEHGVQDRYCADNGVFIIENLCSLDRILMGRASAPFTANTYPVNFEGLTGLPCRVVAKI